MIEKDPIIDKINGLICIDLWGTETDGSCISPEKNQWLEDLSERLQNFEFHSIINAGYHTRLDYSDISIYNTLHLYNWQKFDQQIMLELISNCNQTGMSQVIQDKLFGSHTFALYSIESFIKHVSTLVPHIKDWLVVGCQWGGCAHIRPIGLNNLSKLTGFNFYGTTWGFFKNNARSADGRYDCTLIDQDFGFDTLGWKKVSDQFYLLQNAKSR